MHDLTIPPTIKEALAAEPDRALRVVDPDTHFAYVLIEAEAFDRIRDSASHDHSHSNEGQEALAVEAGKFIGWEDMDDDDRDSEAKS